MSTGAIIAIAGFALFAAIVFLVERFGTDLDLSDPEKLKNKYPDADGGGADAGGVD